MSSAPVLYFDLASPYAYLAVARAASVLPEPPELEPILLGAIFKLRGSGSWAHTANRAMRAAEIEARARHYGLFARAGDPSDVGLLADCAEAVGLDGAALKAAIQRQAIKDKLRQATAAAWAAGVIGVPTLIAGGIVYYGDDQLELAAEAGA